MTQAYPNTVIVIAGPTASGKTALAIQVARHFDTVILSADSRQCYRELNIGVARPSPEELQAVPHYFIASHSIHDEINASFYESYALQLLDRLFITHPIVVVCGGTGLYIKALLEGLDDVPAVPRQIREELTGLYQSNGMVWLKEALEKNDPLFAARGEMQNPQRMLRALEVKMATNRSILEFQKKEKKERAFNTLFLGLDVKRDELYHRINDRVDRMYANGLEAEVESLLPLRHLNALRTVGYQELFDRFDGTLTPDEARTRIKQNTRHYAKRQVTWFKKQPQVKWIGPDEQKSVIAFLDGHLANR